MAEEGSDVYPTIDDNESIDEKQDSPPPPYKAYRGITSSPGYMEKKTLSSTKDDKTVFRGIERPSDDTSNSSTSKKHWKVKALYIIITLILGAGLISALLYFILQYVNQKSVITTNTSKTPGMNEGQNSGLPPESPGEGSSASAGSVCCFNPCSNNGRCKKLNGTNPNFECLCEGLYEGNLCQDRKKFCVSDPCKNGGTCVEQPNYPHYNCTCAIMYEGPTCEKRKAFQTASVTSIQMNTCQPDTCKNGGTCTQQRDRFTCTCTTGYTGIDCATAVSNTAP